jgi:hypothetical protein
VRFNQQQQHTQEKRSQSNNVDLLETNKPKQSFVSNDEEIIDVQNDCGDDYAWILKREQFSIPTLCHEPNGDHEFLTTAVPNVQTLFQAIKRLSQAE